MYICLCLGVTTGTVQHAIDAGARSTKQVAEACGAGSVCGRCNHTIRTMIEDAAPTRRPASPTASAAAGAAANPPTCPTHSASWRGFMIVDSFDHIATETVRDHDFPPEGAV